MVVNSNIGITANGNTYEKSNNGKKAGLIVGGLLPTIASGVKLSLKKDNLLLPPLLCRKRTFWGQGIEINETYVYRKSFFQYIEMCFM